jgi:Domain of unknown function (DUF222)
MPAACAADLRDRLLARVEAASGDAASRQDAELAAEMAGLAATEWSAAPAAGDLCEAVPDLACGPPDGADAWLADLPWELLDEYLTGTQDPPCPEVIMAGRLPRQPRAGCGFAVGGAADDLPPGAVLAGLADDVWAAGLGSLGGDELIGMLRAARRLVSWAAALELTAVADLAARRTAGAGAAGDSATGEHIADEIAAALTLTGRAADTLLDLAMALQRLPATMTALAAGRIDRQRAAVIADEVTGLAAEHAAAVERRVLGAAPDQTSGQLRAATRRAVLATDPAAGRERTERAQRDARVERWSEHAGTAALAGRDLPPAGVLAADQHISALARSLKRAGASGTLDQLRAEVYLALLGGHAITTLLPTGERSADAGTSPAQPGEPGATATPTQPGRPGTATFPAQPCQPGPTGSVNLTVPLVTWLGLSDAPGDVAGYGPLDGAAARDLADLLGRQPSSRWCVTLTGERGQPIAHGCARSGPPPGSGGSRPPPGVRPLPGPPGDSRPPPPGRPPPGPPGGAGPSPKGRPPSRTPGGAGPPSGGRPPSRTPADPVPPSRGGPRLGPLTTALDWLADIAVSKLERGDCGHPRESSAYRPPAALRHLISIRQPTCSFPGCRRPAVQCDQDHTIPHGRGGRTCECNLAPLCRRHHRAKQTRGWALVQPEPGTMIWTTPSGRRYATGPASYPV